MTIKVINFEDRYLQDIRDINVAVSTHPDKPIEEKKLCQYLYIDYYTIFSKENCFVAIDEETEECVGYVISEPNFKRFKDHILNEYIYEAEKLRADFRQVLTDEMVPYEKWNDQYDAHLHMDVKPGHQHQGIGSMLIQHEFNHLRDSGCKGVMLLCSKRNINANNFYQKNGMDIIDELECYVRGIKL